MFKDELCPLLEEEKQVQVPSQDRVVFFSWFLSCLQAIKDGLRRLTQGKRTRTVYGNRSIPSAKLRPTRPLIVVPENGSNHCQK
jgi:hypothetical protein